MEKKIIIELTLLFDEELSSSGKPYLTLQRGNTIIHSYHKFNNVDLKHLLEEGGFLQAIQTDTKPKQWRIYSSKNNDFDKVEGAKLVSDIGEAQSGTANRKSINYWKYLGLILGCIILYSIIQSSGSDEKTPDETTLQNISLPTSKEANNTSIFNSATDFKKKFNMAASRIPEYGYRIDKIDIESGDINNGFKYMLNYSTGFIGKINKKNSSVSNLSIIYQSNGDESSAYDFIVTIGLMINCVDNSLSADQRGEILDDLGLLNAKTISNHSSEIDRNGFHYIFNSDELTGYYFGIEKN